MSQLHAELTEQAAELGFDSIEQAEACGYEVIGTDGWMKLVPRDPLEEMSEAHKAWLEEKNKLVRNAEELLDDTKNYEPSAQEALANMVRSLVEFVKTCHD